MANNKRAQLLAQQQEAQRRRRNRIIVVIAVVVVVALALAGVVIWQSLPDNPVTPAASVASPTQASTAETNEPTGATSSETGMYIPPDGTSDMGYIQVSAANVSPDALIVDEHLDYQCPICDRADAIIGPSLRTLAERGDIVLRIHIRSFLDNQLKNDSSLRAGMAATCADTVGNFIAYHETVFANQPEEGVGYTDQQLRTDFPAMAGITGSDLAQFQTCYDTGQTMAYVQAMEQVNSTSRTINGGDQQPPGGTPAYFVNGTPLNLNQIVNTSWAPIVDTSPDGFLAFLKTVG